MLGREGVGDQEKGDTTGHAMAAVERRHCVLAAAATAIRQRRRRVPKTLAAEARTAG